MMENYTLIAQQLLASDTTRASKIATALTLGHAGTAARAALPVLRQVIADKREDIIVRGYAAWAVEQLAPRPDDAAGSVYHVATEHAAADDANAGTSDQPWKTIQRAAECLRPGDTVLIHAGVYRECVRPFLGGTGPERMITYRAAPGEAPLLTGADPWQVEWRDEGDGRYSAPYQRLPWDWPERWTNPTSGPMHRAEQLMADGSLLTHVATLDEVRRQEGTFYTDDNAGRVWVCLPGGACPCEHDIARSMRQQIFAPAVRGLGYLHVQGLRMRFAANPESHGANWLMIGHRALLSVRAGHHWLIEDNLIEWGNAQGMDIGNEGWGTDLADQPKVSDRLGCHHVRRNAVNAHGVAGIVGWGEEGQWHLLLEDNETNGNGWKGNFYAYEAAGLKIHTAKDCIIRRHRAHGNQAFGIWLDWLCERNRITQCIITDNRAAGIFYEVSAGPILIDCNVILGTQDSPQEQWAEGIYSHDGNHGTSINNYVANCRGFGARMRNLFARTAEGKPTTTSHNRVLNNFLFNNARGAVTFNPEVLHAEDNLSDDNIIWQAGRIVTARLENEDAGVNWEDTPLGQATGQRGGGTLSVPFAQWTQYVGHDRQSVLLPAELLFHGLSPEAIRERLRTLWSPDNPPLDAGYGDAHAQPVALLLSRLLPALAGGRLLRLLQLAPASGLAVWEVHDVLLGLRWQGTEANELAPLSAPFLRAEARLPAPAPISLAVGETVRLAVPAQSRIAFSGLDAALIGDALAISAGAEAACGEYGVVVVAGDDWQRLPVNVLPAFEIGEPMPSRDRGHVITVPLINHRGSAADAVLTLEFLGETITQSCTVPPQTTLCARVPVQADGAGAANVTVRFPGATLTRSALLSFAHAPRATDWEEAPRYPFTGFPGGAFPEGAQAFALFQGGLSAQWAAYYDDAALHILIEVDDAQHINELGPAVLPWQDSANLIAKPQGHPGYLGLYLGLLSSNGEQIVHRSRTIDPARFPLGDDLRMTRHFSRAGHITRYEVAIPWEMIGLPGVPMSNSALRFSLLVNNADGGSQHGLQWFFGIRDHEGDESWMGLLWLD
jgi:parallel beta-helix repeat protein